MIDSPPVQDRQWSRSNTPGSQVFDPARVSVPPWRSFR